jgi:hypothetical protein
MQAALSALSVRVADKNSKFAADKTIGYSYEDCNCRRHRPCRKCDYSCA